MLVCKNKKEMYYQNTYGKKCEHNFFQHSIAAYQFQGFYDNIRKENICNFNLLPSRR
jgi:hypothetical protein